MKLPDEVLKAAWIEGTKARRRWHRKTFGSISSLREEGVLWDENYAVCKESMELAARPIVKFIERTYKLVKKAKA